MTEMYVTKQKLAEMRAHVAAQHARAEVYRKLRHERWGVDERGHLDTQGAMVKLVRSFPALEEALGLEPYFDSEVFVRWAMRKCYSHGEILAARFILSVWNSGTDWVKAAKEWGFKPKEAKCLKRFDLFEALSTFDLEHQAALAAWVEAPFWP